jgi:AraC-like DNA-binding protein
MIFLIGISIAFFLGVLLIGKKGKSFADKILAVWMFLIGTHLLQHYLYVSGQYYHYPFLMGIDLPFPLLHGFMLYLYVAASTNQLPKQRFVIFLHLIPALLSYCYLIQFYILPIEQKISVYQQKGAQFKPFISIAFVACIILGTVYIVWSEILLQKHKKAILERFSYTDKINFNWLQVVIVGLALIWLAIIFTNEKIIYYVVTLFVLYIGYFGIKQAGIFSNVIAVESTEPVKEKLIDEDVVLSVEVDENQNVTEKQRYSKSGLTEEMSGKLLCELNNLMIKDELYKDSELNLTDLANKLKTHPNYLSQVINENENKNFYDYINSFRIEEFKRLLAIPDNKNYTILALAYSCGFYSKSSFNSYFKKTIGMTPSEYMKTFNLQ